jgi:glutamyl-Q tRNA(Asp) synthetase
VSAGPATSRAAVAPARYRGRFAPSPTGPLHFGSLVAALASYCDARAVGGEWLLRIEDVDKPRSRVGAETQILAALERYGFAWDGRVARQSDRVSLYDGALARLLEPGHAYECACTRRELDAAPLGATGERVYPGTCRNGVPPARAGRRQRAWRVRVGGNVLTCNDRLQGAQRQALAHDVGDFVVKRADGLFAYQLAVVVDDADQGITDVVRGADLLSSTPRQILLQKLLGLPTPTYLHVPVAINASGEKLSKQTCAAALPNAPLPTLLAAWRFLGQDSPPDTPANVAEFWHWAHAAWKVSRLPPVPMLPAPAGMEDGTAVGGKR